MDESDRELLTGMGNCYEVCGADFDETVRMVASSRGLTPAIVKGRLQRIREQFEDTETYRMLRGRLPTEFPF